MNFTSQIQGFYFPSLERKRRKPEETSKDIHHKKKGERERESTCFNRNILKDVFQINHFLPTHAVVHLDLHYFYKYFLLIWHIYWVLTYSSAKSLLNSMFNT